MLYNVRIIVSDESLIQSYCHNSFLFYFFISANSLYQKRKKICKIELIMVEDSTAVLTDLFIFLLST